MAVAFQRFQVQNPQDSALTYLRERHFREISAAWVRCLSLKCIKPAVEVNPKQEEAQIVLQLNCKRFSLIIIQRYHCQVHVVRRTRHHDCFRRNVTIRREVGNDNAVFFFIKLEMEGSEEPPTIPAPGWRTRHRSCKVRSGTTLCARICRRSKSHDNDIRNSKRYVRKL